MSAFIIYDVVFVIALLVSSCKAYIISIFVANINEISAFMIKKYTLSFIVSFVLLSSSFSCQKHYDKTYEDYDFVKLKYDNTVDYKKYKTYSLADTLTFVVDTIFNGENGRPDYNIDMDELTDGEYSKSILAKVRENMNVLGLVEIASDSEQFPDISVVITSMTLKQVTQYTYFPQNGYYPGWGNGGWWNNYYTWGVTAYYTSNNGMISVDMFDVLHATPYEDDKKVGTLASSVWHGTYEGIVGPTSESYTARVLFGIDDIFEHDKAFLFVAHN